MAKRKKGSKVRKRAKLRRGDSAKRGKVHKAARAKAAKRTAAETKPKRAPVKKAARRINRSVEVIAISAERINCYGRRGDPGVNRRHSEGTLS